MATKRKQISSWMLLVAVAVVLALWFGGNLIAARAGG
jgi:uncharacterized protein (DUF2062 family)